MPSDADLLAATAAGDADAFATFYRRHLAQVVGVLLRETADRELAADLTGEVFAVALASCARYQPLHDSAAPWLLGIAGNKLRESRRRGRVQDATRRRLGIATLELTDEDLLRVDELGAHEDGPALAAVRDLPGAERDAVHARVVDERDYRDIAVELRCSESVVRQRVSRGLRRLRARLAEQRNMEQRDKEGQA
ncbi:MAG: RNA polymerase sigma factor [Solirubrobacteraceae bacterium]